MLEQLFSNLIVKLPEFGQSIIDTFVMLGITGLFSLIFGTFFGVILVVTKEGNILENKIVYTILSTIIDLFRAIPFIILIIALISVTRFVMGTSIGIRGAVFPLIVGSVPFFARQVESALSEVDNGLIEASQAMGCSPIEIIFRVYLKESIPALIRATTITLIAIIGYISMAGAVGAGGIGDFAIRYGAYQYETDTTICCIIVLLLITTLIQSLGNYLERKTTH